MMAKAKKIWAKSPTRSKLSTLAISGLHFLCLELNIQVPNFTAGKRRQKKPYIDALLVSRITSWFHAKDLTGKTGISQS